MLTLIDLTSFLTVIFLLKTSPFSLSCYSVSLWDAMEKAGPRGRLIETGSRPLEGDDEDFLM